PNAVIPTAPAIIANKGRQHGAAKAITRAPTVPRPSSKATVRVRRLMLISKLEAVSKIENDRGAVQGILSINWPAITNIPQAESRTPVAMLIRARACYDYSWHSNRGY